MVAYAVSQAIFIRYLSCKVDHVLYLNDLFLIAHSALAAYQISPYRLRLV